MPLAETPSRGPELDPPLLCAFVVHPFPPSPPMTFAPGDRERTGLSQAQFAVLHGVSVRTLQEWEQGRRAPSGAARTLLMIAARNPRALVDVA